jgi:DNA ligase 1
MQQFAQLYTRLDATTSTNDKLAAMQDYFAATPPEDAAWALYFLAGGKPRQAVRTSQLKALAREAAGIEEWLFDECYQAVGDLAETIAYVVPNAPPQHVEMGAGSDNISVDNTATQDVLPVGLAQWMQRLSALRGMDELAQAVLIRNYWRALDAQGRFLMVKLIGGGFRVGVSKLLVTRALAAHAGLDAKVMAQRLMGYLDAKQEPSASKYIAACAEDTALTGLNATKNTLPYPFFLAHALPPEHSANTPALQAQLGDVSQWQAEWKYDGIRAQIVKRTIDSVSQVAIWSRGEELMTERFPEINAMAQSLPEGTVLDGEILVVKDGQVASFNLLQQRIGRKTLTKKVLADAPVGFMAYDLLELDGQDLRSQPQHLRRAALGNLLAPHPQWLMSPVVSSTSWADLAAARTESRARGVEGLMLKRLDAAYGVGRTKADGLWLKWKIDPLSVDCVLIYAQAGHGRRASVYTDYTFAVWNRTPRDAAEAQTVLDAIAARVPAPPLGSPTGDSSAAPLQLVAFAKAYSGLTDEEFKTVDAVIRKTTLEKFGPVRSVKPSLVFELGFEGINTSPRHKSGIAVRFPRMLRIRFDKPLHEANTLEDLKLLLN